MNVAINVRENQDDDISNESIILTYINDAPEGAEFYETDENCTYVEYWCTSSENEDDVALIWNGRQWEYADDGDVVNFQLAGQSYKYTPLNKGN